MKLTRDTSSYNDRRYSKPWIAKLSLSGNELKFNFGTWCGDAGSEGVLILDNVEIGDYIARGQKDFRQPRNSAPDYYKVIDAVGNTESATKPEAYKALASKK